MDGNVQGWVVRMDAADRPALEALRLSAGVEVATFEGGLWVRGPRAEGTSAALPDRLPVRERFELLEDGVLRSPGARVPCARLPREVQWSDLRSWIGIGLPGVLPSAVLGEGPKLRLTRGGVESVPDALLLALDLWVRWAENAPAVRLRPLRFAAAVASALDGLGPARALVLGEPLPPLPGTRLVSRAGVLVPAGWQWQPAVDPAVARRVLGLRGDEIALWSDDGSPVSIIPAEAVVPASRSAARLTRQRAHGEPSIDDP